jgi:hypothetical protein
MSMRTENRLQLLGACLALLSAIAVSGCDTEVVTRTEYTDPRLRDCMMFTCTCAFNEECPDPLSCVNGTCVVYDGPDIRLPPDDRPNGAACDFGFQCEGTVCVTDPFGGGYCSEFCDTGCPEGWACERGGDSEFAYDLCVEPCGGAGSRDEVCNVRDDDCDTLVDEGFVDANGDYTSVENCGVCGNDCERVLNNATGVECAIIGGTPTCRATECAPGYFSFQDGIACLPLPDNLCQPCTTDGDCLVPTSRCADIGAGVNACTRDCDTDSLYGTTCPTGYTCSDIGGGDSQCVPTGGTCSCTAATEGLERPCLVDPGACPGTEICTLLGNTYDFDACSADGLLPEICDGVDNDCDGSIDEPYADAGGRYTSIEHCGACGNNCNFIWTPAVNHAIASCDTALPVPACRIDMCVSENIAGVDYDWVDANQDTDDGCECRRLSGNTNVDPPDVEFVDVLGTRTYPNASAVYVDENCDGIDGVIGDALFVRAGAAPGGTGTRAQPFATVGAALAAFQASTKAYILVATGIYTESVTLVQGVEVHGGYSSDFSRRNIVSFPTVIAPLAPAPGTYTAAIFASSITGPSETVVSGFVLRGYDVAYTPASGPGGATYAAHITDSDDSLALVNNRIVGGEGGRGARGANSAVGFGVFSMGGAVLNGGNGSNPPDAGQTCPAGACPGGSQVVGGAAGTNPSCGGASGILGGSATCPVFPLPSYTPPIPGLDGDPGYHWTRDSATQGSSCNSHMTEAGFPSTIVPLEGGDGRPGAGGNAGSQGLGCASGFGSFVAGVWVPGSAQVGAQGAAGQRGGTGAPSGGFDTASMANMPAGVSANTTQRYRLGASGGGSGAGGCGGAGGASGGTGGASIGILVFFTGGMSLTPPTIHANVVARGLGGDGGEGGAGGRGGTGGNGGIGGNSNGFWVPFRAGNGGRGGIGGTGGGGGGGCGGASIGVAVAGLPMGATIDYLTSNTFAVPDGTPTGGGGGNAGATGVPTASADGSAGSSQNVYIP